MTVLNDTRLAFTAAVAAQLPDVQVSAHPMADDQKVKESIWVERAESLFEWRSLGIGGMASRNRTEDIALDMRFEVFREGANQSEVCEAAIARCEVLLASAEDALEADFSIGGVVTHAKFASWSVDPAYTDTGWLITGRARLEATNHP